MIFLIENRNSSLYQHTIDNFSVQIQEYAIIEDLLYVLIVRHWFTSEVRKRLNFYLI
jgi:hypothetical protein